MTQSEPGPEVKSFAALDLSGADGKPETGGQAFGRIAGGIALMLLGIAVVVGCAAAFIAGLLVPSLWDWAELIMDGAWFVGAIGVGLVIVGFTLLRSGRRRRAASIEAAVTLLEVFTGEPETEPETSKRIMPTSTEAAPPPPKPIL